jgi:hypothetical protein
MNPDWANVASSAAPSAPPATYSNIPEALAVPTADLQGALGGTNQAADRRDPYTGFLSQQHRTIPRGIKEEFIRAADDFPVRYWVVDNSGSMTTSDGHELITSRVGSKSYEGFNPCSRWKELSSSLNWIGTLAIDITAHTEFHLLNPSNGVQEVVLGAYGTPPAIQRQELDRLVASSPTGRTPICTTIRNIISKIQPQAAELRATGKRAVVVIATDGVSTDGDLAQALRPLEQLPVWVVVRLCTDDDSVVEYWNGIDEEVELDMDVLDDVKGEAVEVNSVNPWMVYGPALHRLREWGSSNKLFDLLDEARFNAQQAQEMVALVFGRDAAADLPAPAFDMRGFIRGVDALQQFQSDYTRAGAQQQAGGGQAGAGGRPLQHSGWMTKRGHIRQNWLARWFTVNGTIVEYAATPGQAIRGTLDMRQCQVVRPSTDPAKQPFEMEVVMPGRTYLFRSQNDSEFRNWMRMLTAAQAGGVAPAAEGGAAQPPPPPPGTPGTAGGGTTWDPITEKEALWFSPQKLRKLKGGSIPPEPDGLCCIS